MDVSRITPLMFTINLNGAVIHTVIDPAILDQFWASLSIQVIPGNNLIGIPGPTFRILDDGGKHFIAHNFAKYVCQPFPSSVLFRILTGIYYSAVREAMVKFVIDGSGTHPDRYFLGRASFFEAENIVSSVGDLDVWVPPGYPLQDSVLSTEMNAVAPATGVLNRRNARGGAVKVPRPPNAYILYRKDHHKEMKQSNPKLSNNDICKIYFRVHFGYSSAFILTMTAVILGRKWNHESDEVRIHYHKMAVEIKKQVEILHPHYKYSPRKPCEIRRRARGNHGVYTVQDAASEGSQEPDSFSTAASMPTPPTDFDAGSVNSLSSMDN